MEYLARKELDIHPSRDELSYYQEQCILYISGQRHKIRTEMKDGGDLDDEETQFRLEADPGEMDVSDRELLNLAAATKRR